MIGVVVPINATPEIRLPEAPEAMLAVVTWPLSVGEPAATT